MGIGLESVDLLDAQRMEYKFAIAQMQRGIWQRHFGRRLVACTVGIIGAGRIGVRVVPHLHGFGLPPIMVNDTVPEATLGSRCALQWADKEEIYRQAAVVTLHLALTAITRHLIRREELLMMKPDAILINTARGGIINEQDLAVVMRTGHLGGAAIDAFEVEHYSGELAGIERCLLTAHMGSMSVDCRTRMEIEATQEAVRFVSGQQLLSPVPPEEYEVQRQSE